MLKPTVARRRGGLSDTDFDTLFTTNKPIIFAYHGYPWLIHRLTYRRTNHLNLHVRGYKAAVRDGQPLDTTMGFTPAGGFMMGTRSGDLDPGILLHLMREQRYDTRQIEQLVNHESGLLGVSGTSSDMKTLLEAQDTDPNAAQAVEMFCYQLCKHIGALAAVLGGLDTLVFTGGIGERAAPVRWEVCRGLEHLGIHLDPQRNTAHADPITMPHSSCVVRVIPTNEDLMIARHTRTLIFPRTTKPTAGELT
jgi:acetate kinase